MSRAASTWCTFPTAAAARPSLAAVAGDTPIAFAALSAAVPLVKDGKLRALAVMSEHRSQALPELPTIAQAGYPGLEGDGWVGVLVPAGTPADIIALLHREIVAIIALPDMQARLSALGFEPVGNTPEEFALQMKLEMEKWAKVIRAANIKAQ